MFDCEILVTPVVIVSNAALYHRHITVVVTCLLLLLLKLSFGYTEGKDIAFAAPANAVSVFHMNWSAKFHTFHWWEISIEGTIVE